MELRSTPHGAVEEFICRKNFQRVDCFANERSSRVAANFIKFDGGALTALYRFLNVMAYDSRMDEKRNSARRRVLKGGTIEFNGGAIDCTVRNLSAAGAALDVTSPVGIPEHFVLVADGSRLPCHVIWRKEKRIGIAFDRKPSRL